MTKPKQTLMCFVAGFCVSHLGMADQYHKAKATVRVIDEQGRPITNATAWVGFSKNIPRGEGWGTKPFSVRGKTDTNGMFIAEATGNPHILYGSEKDGYYRTQNLRYSFEEHKLGKWKPWNPSLEVVLKKIGTPVPMYARRVEKDIPVEKDPVAFDLEKGDWVKPYGNGEREDFVFSFSRSLQKSESYEATLTLRFPNEGDGMQSVLAEPRKGSHLRLPSSAPALAYQRELVWRMGYSRKKGYFGFESPDGQMNYMYRVRTVLDDKGKIEKALYGKIHGPIQVAGIKRSKARIIFTYYLNPDGTRNLEFDPGRNLFKNLSSLENVRKP